MNLSESLKKPLVSIKDSGHNDLIHDPKIRKELIDIILKN